MVFSSLLFLTIFLPIVVVLYYLIPNRGKNVLLLVASLVFYGWGEPIHILIMLATTVYIWILGLYIAYCQRRGRKGLSKAALFVALTISIGMLVFYKYTAFFLENIPFLRNSILEIRKPSLPIGISFYTFQSLSYVIDVYRGTVKAQKSWIRFAVYISLFPQLIAGPIVRYTDIEHQLTNRTYSFENTAEGIKRFVIGLGKKVLLANQIGLLWEEITGLTCLSLLDGWLGAIAFALQIYFDFSAYSDMAIGLGKMLGFEFPENFRYPYTSESITDFWRRWHITLGIWFREYVYIPLGGNRKGICCQIRNLFIVWLLTGFWHGADWQFILWGLYYGAFLIIEKLVLGRRMKTWPKFWRHIYTLLVVAFGWVMFASSDLQVAGIVYRAMLGIGVPLVSAGALFRISEFGLLLILGGIGATELPIKLVEHLKKHSATVCLDILTWCAVFAILFISIAFLAGDSYNPFLYFRF